MTMHRAPNIESMIEACQDALRYRRRLLPGDAEVTTLVDPVPHFVPGMGSSGEWYRVGALRLVEVDRYLTIYLDAISGDVQVEQTMMQVEAEVDPQHNEIRQPNHVELHRWENDGGATLGSMIPAGLQTWPTHLP